MPPSTRVDKQDKDAIAKRLKELPKVVQDAILSADVEAHLRQLAQMHKLHFDQWASLENEVMFALLGFEPVEALPANIEKQVGVPRTTANALAEDISRVVFAPIRENMEQELAKQTPPESAAASQTEGAPAPAQREPAPSAPAVLPATPPPPPPEEKAVRAPVSETYTAGQASHERKTIEGDPYREPTV